MFNEVSGVQGRLPLLDLEHHPYRCRALSTSHPTDNGQITCIISSYENLSCTPGFLILRYVTMKEVELGVSVPHGSE